MDHPMRKTSDSSYKTFSILFFSLINLIPLTRSFYLFSIKCILGLRLIWTAALDKEKETILGLLFII